MQIHMTPILPKFTSSGKSRYLITVVERSAQTAKIRFEHGKIKFSFKSPCSCPHCSADSSDGASSDFDEMDDIPLRQLQTHMTSIQSEYQLEISSY